MNRLDNLIHEFCPHGVVHTRIADISTVLRGKRLTKNELTTAGAFPVFHGGLEPLGFYSQKNREADTTMVINVGASAGTVGFCERDFWSSDGCFCISHSEHALSKYVYYVLVNQQSFLMSKVRKAGIPTLDAKVVENLQIPLPPLAVQQEIVRILDSFTELTAELTAELTSELTARRKQYEHYRDELLTFGDDVPMVPLGEICNVQAGGTPSKKEKQYWTDGTIKWLGSTVCQNQKTVDSVTDYITELGLEKSSARIMPKDSTLIALVGATIGKVAFLPFEAAINQNIAGVYPKHPDKVNPSYVYYACTMLYPEFIGISQGKLALANLSFVRGLKIPLPSIEVQEHTAAILDRFDAICNDLTSGLPAEITARQKQYEYYRNKLLTFKESES